MTLLFADGMDVYDATADLPERYDDIDAGLINWGAAFGRFGGGGIKVTNDDTFFKKNIAGLPDTVILSCAIFIESAASVQADTILKFGQTGSTGGLIIRTKVGGQDLEIVNGAAILDTFTVALDTWHWISMKIFANNSTGTFEVELDGTQVVNVTGADTQSGSAPEFVAIQFGADLVQPWTWDDIIITDDAGASPLNDLLPDRRIDTLFPDGAGGSTNWTPSSGTNFSNAQVNDGDTNYNSSATSGDLDLYTMDDMNFTPGTIDAVLVTSVARNPDAGPTQYKNRLRVSAANADGADLDTTTSYAYASDTFLVDPDTAAAWTLTGVNAAQAGVEIV